MLLEAKDICFGYTKNNMVLKDINLGIKPGERVALIGPSGCGKSTLSQILAGYLTPSSGSVLFEGKPLPKEGYCPVQLIYQHPEKAINPRWKLQKTLNEAWEPDETFLAEMGIEKQWLTRYPNELSGGELQRFCVARALGPQTQFVIADEMTTMLDVITQAQMWRLMLTILEKRGLGLLVVTHSLELAEQICSRVIKFEELGTNHGFTSVVD
ncbi:peptide ABC transporter [Anaerocolumna cellulosilytica]|uniref:Peptide ABC transporter n=1 Tax=Anaerocolumna cellulosilytica TaxID=433286 RepID=A0A6S6QT90_9FIRM|nr:ATP-binding cassette domain-containing protein [Anaerocolumna cellulosilytica]MBB5195591.1 peptide/nickel transport system ATP-binding protein [Anaerocolumna cellulosilytica]BCJ93834.1 peptide ABC transporter [Anaerocolumna cellulosilytica]